jgi:Fe-S-cluster-containing hydrogenase component 2
VFFPEISVAYKISDKCIQCHACIWNHICPEEAIIEHDNIFSIDPEKCTGCGTCYDQEIYFCPVRAIIEV